MNKLNWWLLRRRLRLIQLLVLDVDGVLTDGVSGSTPGGKQALMYETAWGFAFFSRRGSNAFLSGGKGGATEVRARQLGITHCLVGVKDKAAALNALQKQLGISSSHTAFVGDDLNDLSVRPMVELLISPADACRPVRRRADAILQRKGGHGAVRELAEHILQVRGSWGYLRRYGWKDQNA